MFKNIESHSNQIYISHVKNSRSTLVKETSRSRSLNDNQHLLSIITRSLVLHGGQWRTSPPSPPQIHFRQSPLRRTSLISLLFPSPQPLPPSFAPQPPPPLTSVTAPLLPPPPTVPSSATVPSSDTVSFTASSQQFSESPAPLLLSQTLPPLVPVPSETSPSKSPALLWSNLFSSAADSQQSYPVPSYLADGTPVVRAPPQVILKSSELWKGHLLCTFFGNPPPPNKIFNDLNPIWGKHGTISVRQFTEGSCLIFIPSILTRKWVCEVGFWSAGTVAFSAVEWEPSPKLHSPYLSSAPLWLTLRDIPPQLWSVEGFNIIASGVGLPLPPKRTDLSPALLGTAKIRAIVDLEKPLPSSVVVEDSDGNTARIGVEYSRLPPRCSSCLRFGHAAHRCPSPSPPPPPASPSPPSPPIRSVHNGAATVQNSEVLYHPSKIPNSPKAAPEAHSLRPIYSQNSSSKSPPKSLSKFIQKTISAHHSNPISRALPPSSAPSLLASASPPPQPPAAPTPSSVPSGHVAPASAAVVASSPMPSVVVILPPASTSSVQTHPPSSSPATPLKHVQLSSPPPASSDPLSFLQHSSPSTGSLSFTTLLRQQHTGSLSSNINPIISPLLTKPLPRSFL